MITMTMFQHLSWKDFMVSMAGPHTGIIGRLEQAIQLMKILMMIQTLTRPLDCDSDEAKEAEAEVDHKTYAEPVSVPEHNNPFLSEDSVEMWAFVITLTSYKKSHYTPLGYGMTPSELEDGLYPTIQPIPAGHWGSRQLEIGLPDAVWCLRSVLWVWVLDVILKIKNVTGSGA